ncbi:glycosyltransferase [Amylibacter sp.]|nr:glycosyltransferase [Amylibacter sp.]
MLNNGRQGPINGRPNLSILIASLRSRKLKLERLLTSLGTHSSVEALVEVDDGELSIGLKRQTLLDRANGKYIVYLDDDDIVAENFVAKILENIKFNPDAIGYWIEHHKDGHKQFIKKMTLGLTSQVMYQGDLLSPLTHRSVVKREILNEFTFPDIDWAEDRPYWAHIQKKIRWEKVILLEDILYYQFEISAKYSSDGNHNGQ